MASLATLMDEVADLVGPLIAAAREVRPSEMGLDNRAASRLWVGEDFIAVPLGGDRTLQYYGGFEYVDGEHRLVFGDWVFYSTESERVQGCVERLYGEEGEE